MAPERARAAQTSLLGRPGQLDREARTPERLQVRRRDLPPVGEAVHELRTSEVHRCAPPARRPARAGDGLPTLVDALTEHELERLGRAR